LKPKTYFTLEQTSTEARRTKPSENTS